MTEVQMTEVKFNGCIAPNRRCPTCPAFGPLGPLSIIGTQSGVELALEEANRTQSRLQDMSPEERQALASSVVSRIPEIRNAGSNVKATVTETVQNSLGIALEQIAIGVCHRKEVE